jgi:hypothetical protein
MDRAEPCTSLVLLHRGNEHASCSCLVIRVPQRLYDIAMLDVMKQV